jgi:hypothetical protein
VTRQDGRIDYVEFATANIAGSRAFFAEAFGWGFTEYGPTYLGFEEAGLDGGFQGDPGDAAAPLVILYAADLEDAEARVRAAGGAVLRPIYAFPGGRRFHFREPGGNELAVWSET